MSALGQKRTSEHVRFMSALPPKADIGTHSRDVRFVPKADIQRFAWGVIYSPPKLEIEQASSPITGERSMKGAPSELAFSARS